MPTVEGKDEDLGPFTPNDREEKDDFSSKSTPSQHPRTDQNEDFVRLTPRVEEVSYSSFYTR